MLKELHWLIPTSLYGGLTPPSPFITTASVEVVLQL